jgi:hypothetical protein
MAFYWAFWFSGGERISEVRREIVIALLGDTIAVVISRLLQIDLPLPPAVALHAQPWIKDSAQRQPGHSQHQELLSQRSCRTVFRAVGADLDTRSSASC